MIDAWFKDMDARSVQNAKGAIGVLVGDQGLDGLTQTDLQVFLWYTLPAKFLVETTEHHEVAWALGDALRNAGLDRYADLCRAAETHLIIDAYAVSRPAGLAAYRKAAEAAGLEPPDTDLMQWGPVMGPAEHAVRDRLSSRLEQAVVEGELTPGPRGWKKVAQRIAEDFLSLEGSDGRRPFQVVEAERIERWGRDGRQHREALYRRILPFLLEEPELTEELVRESVAPARALLEGIGDGVTMTQAGWLPKALVVELNDRFRWYDLPGYKANSEADVIDLQSLHGLLRQTKLLTPRGRKLSVSAKGKQQLRDDRSLFETLAVATLRGDDAGHDVVQLTAGALLIAEEPQSSDQLESIIRPTVDETWRSKSGQTITHEQIIQALWDWWSSADTFGWQEESGVRWPGHELTQTGRVAVVIALRAIAAGPRSS